MPDLTPDQIRYLFTLPPEDIVRWYQSKGYNFSWDWRDTWQSANTRSYAVAKVMKLDILQELKNETDKIWTEGITPQKFRRDLEPVLRDLGWWGKKRADEVPGYDPASGVPPDKIVELGSPRRLKTIYTVNANVANNAGRYKFFMQNTASRPYWQYKQIPRPTRREEHLRYADKIFRYDDPIWDIIYPPNGWNCGCYVIALTGDEVVAKGLTVENGGAFKTDDIEPEWSYNPAKSYTAWKPDRNDYDSDLQKYL
jgi:uncharacterized protein with gpF-like domain